MEQKQDSPSGGGLSHSAAEAIAAVGIFAVGVVMIIDNYKIGAGWAVTARSRDIFPLRIGVICASPAWWSVQVFVRQAARARDLRLWQRLKPVLLVLLPHRCLCAAINFSASMSPPRCSLPPSCA